MVFAGKDVPKCRHKTWQADAHKREQEQNPRREHSADDVSAHAVGGGSYEKIYNNDGKCDTLQRPHDAAVH